jgi:hypothetical protein
MPSGPQLIKDIGTQTAPASTALIACADASTGVALPASVAQVVVAGLGAAAFGTLTSSTPSYVTQTWNSGGVTFSARRVNITDTASASGSLLDDLQVGGVSKFSVNKAGNVVAAGTLAVTGASTLTGNVTASGSLSVGTTLAVTGVATFTAAPVLPTQTPASAAAAGTAGTVVWDSGYIYVCTATNTWKRAAIATW